MAYYDEVYLPRLNKNGTTRQERVLAIKAQQFKDSFLDKSIYKVEFLVNYVSYTGVLQPVKESEKEIVYYLLLPIEDVLDVGQVFEANDLNWLITFSDSSPDKGYNKYKVYLLDRILTWWDEDKVEHSTDIHLCGNMESSIRDAFRTGIPTFREGMNPLFILMRYDETIKQDTYVKIDQSDRNFIVTGFDIETVPNVAYITLDITMKRDEDDITTVPTSYWEV